MRRYEITIDGKIHSVSIHSPFAEGSKIHAAIDGREVTAVFLRSCKTDSSGIFRIENRVFHIDLSAMRDAISPTIRVDGRPVVVKLHELRTAPLQKVQLPDSAKPVSVSHGVIVAPIPGKVMSLRVRKGDSVKPGHPLLMLEAMKMENEILAAEAGTVREVWVTEGTTVKKDQRLIEIS